MRSTSARRGGFGLRRYDDELAVTNTAPTNALFRNGSRLTRAPICLNGAPPECRKPASDENIFRQTVRHRQEVAADRRRRAGARPARLAHRDAAARQAQAVLHAAYGLRRPCRRRQCREGAADRQQARRRHLLLAYRLSRRHQGPQQGRDPRRQAPRAGDREGGRAHGAARPARPAGDAQPAGLCRARAPARGAEPGAARYRRDEPQECEG